MRDRTNNDLSQHERMLVTCCVHCLHETVRTGVMHHDLGIEQEHSKLKIEVATPLTPSQRAIRVTEEAILKMLLIGNSGVQSVKITICRR